MTLCEECGEETNGLVCKKCGLVINDRPIAQDMIPLVYVNRRMGKLMPLDHDTWESPLSPKIRRKSRGFNLIYHKMGKDGFDQYLYLKAYETISKLCSLLRVPRIVRYEALNLFKGIRNINPDFFKVNKLAPTYLACIKIACKIHDYPITARELADVIDYKIADNSKNNMAYMEKKFNRSYRAIKKLYNLSIPQPEHPRFIDFACDRIDAPYSFAIKIHKIYTQLKDIFKGHYRIEGYILAIIYIFGKEAYNLTLKKMEEMFQISSLTISKRKNELLEVVRF